VFGIILHLARNLTLGAVLGGITYWTVSDNVFNDGISVIGWDIPSDFHSVCVGRRDVSVDEIGVNDPGLLGGRSRRHDDVHVRRPGPRAHVVEGREPESVRGLRLKVFQDVRRI